MSVPIVFDDEVMLLDWSETAKGGAKIVLQLPSPEALAPFRGMTLAKGKVAGQRLAAVFVLIDDNEQPIAPPTAAKGGPLSRLAAQWCNDATFQDWLASNFAHAEPTPEGAAEAVRLICNVQSRAELDHDEVAKATFDRLIRIPYRQWLAEHEGASNG